MANSISRLYTLFYFVAFLISSAIVFDTSGYPLWGSLLLAIGFSLIVYWKLFVQKSLLTNQPAAITGADGLYVLLLWFCIWLVASDLILIRLFVSYYGSLFLYEWSKYWRKKGVTVSDAICFAVISCLFLLLCQRWLSAFFMPYCSLCAWHDLFKKRKQPRDKPIRQIASERISS